MISVCINRADFEYDIHSLIRGFFPGEEVRVNVDEPENAGDKLHLDIVYGEQDICMSLKMGDNCIKDSVELENTERIHRKNKLKQMLYKNLSDVTGKTLPWGTLTGIRPAKLVLQELKSGVTPEQAVEHMRKTYFSSEEKISLCVHVAQKEHRMLSKVDCEQGYSVYVAIPFCPSTCLYCSFTSNPLGMWAKRMDEYLDAVEKEIDYFAEKMAGKKLHTIYIGGGTPTTLEPHQLTRLIRKLKSAFDLTYLQEFTVEAGRPDSITREKLLALRAEGITRISINPQTMKQDTLRIIGRHHTVEQTVEAFKLARELGFDNINMDMIVGLPNEDEQDVKNTLERIRELAPDNLTVHSLAIKRAARLNMFAEDYKDYRSENSEALMEMTQTYAAGMGMEPYYLYRQKNMTGNMENVGYAVPGKECLYNVMIMEEQQTILAFGAGASTKIVCDAGERVERVENVKDVGVYLERIDEMIERKEKVLCETGVLK